MDLNVLDLIGFTLGQLLPLLFIVLMGPSLAVVIPAALLARALSVAVNLGWVARIEGVSTLLIFDRSRFKELFKFGFWVTVTNVVGPLLVSVDQLLVGSSGSRGCRHLLRGAYELCEPQPGTFPIACGDVVSPLLPTEPEGGDAACTKAVLSLGYGFGAICGPAIVIGELFLTLWLGADFAFHATLVLELLLIGAWFNGIADIPYSFLQGQGRPDLVAKWHVLQFLPFIALLWFLLHRFGLLGAALAWSTRVAVELGRFY